MKTFMPILAAVAAFYGTTVNGQIDGVLNSQGLFSGFGVLSEDGVKNVLNDRNAVSKAYSSYANQYSKTAKHERLDTFQANLKAIASHNFEARKSGGYEMGVNQFTDMSSDEFIKKHTGYTPSSSGSQAGPLAAAQKPPLARKWKSPPSSLDWRTYKVVSPVKNQKGCGSCVFFSATGVLEASHALWHDGEILDLSEQELVDCAKGDGNNGCQGGTFKPTFAYLTKTGLTTEDQYEYTASDSDGFEENTCKAEGLEHPAKLSGWWPVKSGDEKALMTAVANYGPVAVAVCVNSEWQGYKKGILDINCKCGRNHAVSVVGYGSEGGKDFWIVKNSWGEDFGEAGYVRMRRNKGNMCDVAGDAVYVNA